MKCDELKLFSYFEGISGDRERNEIEVHLKDCKRCQQELEQLKFTIRAFTEFYASKDRSNCPSGEELVLFKRGMVDEDHASKIRLHVDNCPDCQKELGLLQAFAKAEDSLRDMPIKAPSLSEGILAKIGQMKKDSMRDRLEKTLRSILAKGKGAITPDKIPELLDQYFARTPDMLSAYALPTDATLSDTQLALREPGLFADITFEIGKYEVLIQSKEGALTVRIYREKKPVKGIEIILETVSSGELRGVTDIH